jgi:hypothetical protein
MGNGVLKKYVILNACEEFNFFASVSMLIGHFKVKLKKMCSTGKNDTRIHFFDIIIFL